MFSWLKKKFSADHTITLPGNIGTIVVPAGLQTEWENDSTLVLFPRGNEAITLRITTSSFAKPEGSDDGIMEEVRNRARELNIPVQELPNKVVISYSQETEENGVPVIIRFWEIATRNTMMLLSATILKAKEEDAAVMQTLSLIPQLIDTAKVKTSHRIIEHEGESFQASVEEVEPTPQMRLPFSESETVWLTRNLETAITLGRKYGSGGVLTPRELDSIFSRWLHEPEKKDSGDAIANALGAAFGQFIVSENGFSWVVVKDEYGEEFAVHHPLGETMAYPRASVQKRVESGADDFFEKIYLTLLDQLERAKDGN